MGTVGINCLLFRTAERAFDLLNSETMEIDKLCKRQRQHFDFHTAAGQIGGIFRRKQVGVGAGDVDVAIQIHAKRIDRVFPACHTLQFIEKQIHPLARQRTLFHILIQVI